MSESSDHVAGDGDKPVDETQTSVMELPVVAAPQISGEDHEAQEYEAQEYEAHREAADEGSDETKDEPNEAASAAQVQTAPVQSRRFLMLAATLAFAAAFGSFVGSVSGSGLVQFIAPARRAAATDNTIAATQQMKAELAEISAIKASLENAARVSTSQYTKIADRLDQLDRRTASAPADVTGSLAGGAQSDQSSKLADRILQDWTVDDVQDGRALVESRYGGVFDVGAGSILPGLGQVDTIKRQDGRWFVLTARGTITSGR